jgi:hypothetical protein
LPRFQSAEGQYHDEREAAELGVANQVSGARSQVSGLCSWGTLV